MGSYTVDAAAQARLDSYFASIAGLLKDRRKRESFAMYAFGLFADGERKSAEPIAARTCGDPDETQHTHDKLLHFLARSTWDDRAVRLAAARYAIGALEAHEPVVAWIVDDTGFLKQGTHSVGVQRQYTGSAGKVTNCQIGVSLAVATRGDHLPLDFELYLPEVWTEDAARRAAVHVPADVAFRTKPEMALGMIERAHEAELPGEIILADSAYGESSDFRCGVRALGFDYAVGIHGPTLVHPIDARGRTRPPISIEKLAAARLQSRYRRVTWREGTKAKLRSRFHFWRVKIAHDDGFPLDERESVWLMAEWPEGEAKPTKFHLTTLPRRMGKREIVRMVKERWRTERMYEDLKGELGLDHFEGRSFPGWHHHVSVVLCCHAFIVAERARTFPPSARRTRSHRPLDAAA
jgi:SRSO17 transposase